MKRLLILVAVVALAMYVASRPVLAVAQHHGGHSGHHGGHSGGHIGHSGGHIGHSGHHIGHSVHRSRHVGHHVGHHGSSLHLSFGSGHHYSSYGYRSPYRYSYGYSYPAYRSYSYPTYRRTYRYVNPSCYGPSVIVIPPIQPKAEEEDDDEQPEVDPAPEPVPAPAPVPSAGTSPLAPGTIRYAVLRSQQPLSERATVQQPAELAPNRIAAPTPGAPAAGSLGPRLAAPKVRSLISDDDVPWVVQ